MKTITIECPYNLEWELTWEMIENLAKVAERLNCKKCREQNPNRPLLDFSNNGCIACKYNCSLNILMHAEELWESMKTPLEKQIEKGEWNE